MVGSRSVPKRKVASRRETGSALLALLTLIVLAGTTLFLGKLNGAVANRVDNDRKSMAVLAEAKAALIGYAVSDDNRPGELPCPDWNHDGASSVSSGDYSGPNCTTLRGWLPWQQLRLADLRDGDRTRLWYALSDDFHAGKPNTVLNSETPGQLTVGGAGDIVAVVIAPGRPFEAQDGRLPPNDSASDADAVVAEYLENANADGDQTSYVAAAVGDFNDRLITITRRELMEAVERRVAGEVAEVLARHQAAYGAYPWLSPFVNPRGSAVVVSGVADGGSATSLNDSGVDFVALGVQPGFVVHNVDDGSRGIVATVATNSLTVDDLRFGDENDFDTGDSYLIRLRLTGTATAGSTGLTLIDGSEDFIAKDVRVGDLVINTTDGSIGAIAAVATVQLTVSALAGGADNDFNSGDGYEVLRLPYSGVPGAAEGHVPYHANHDVASPSAHENIHDIRTSFVADWNLRQDRGNTRSVTSGLASTYENSLERFAETSAYLGPARPLRVPLSDGVCVWKAAGVAEANCTGSTRLTYFRGSATGGSGGLTLEDAARGFVDWGVKPGDIVENITDSGSGVVESVTAAAPGTPSTLEVQSLTGGASFDDGDLYRVRVASRRTGLAPALSANAGSTDDTLVDTDVDFVAMGVRDGDTVYHVNDDVWRRITAVTDANTLQVDVLPGLVFADSDDYEIYYEFVDEREYELTFSYAGTSALVGLAGLKTRDVCVHPSDCGNGRATIGSANLTLVDSNANFNTPPEVRINDVIQNLSDGSWGRVNGVANTTLTVSRLIGGVRDNDADGVPDNDFRSGDLYRVGRSAEQPDLPAQPGLPSVTVRDFHTLGHPVGQATITIPSGGSPLPSGDLYTSEIRVDLEVDPASSIPLQLPQWFVDNNWHHLIYAAAASEILPGGAGSCTPGTDCLRLENDAGLAINDDDRALVLAAGGEVASQDRTVGSICGTGNLPFICDYFERENADNEADEGGPPTFEKNPIAPDFNDQVRVVRVLP